MFVAHKTAWPFLSYEEAAQLLLGCVSLSHLSWVLFCPFPPFALSWLFRVFWKMDFGCCRVSGLKTVDEVSQILCLSLLSIRVMGILMVVQNWQDKFYQTPPSSAPWLHSPASFANRLTLSHMSIWKNLLTTHFARILTGSAKVVSYPLNSF